MKTPVVLILYKRIDALEKQMKVLETVRPEILYLVSDAAPDGDEVSIDLVQRVRERAEHIKWDCQLHKIYADRNMGCDQRIISGLNVVFEHEDAAIILEDDCIPDPSFFQYCDELLEKYQFNKDIFYVSGNHLAPWKEEKTSYIFSRRGDTWGWATWANRWQAMHRNFVDEWQDVKSNHLLQKRMGKKAGNAFVREVEQYWGQRDIPWDYQWHARCLAYGKKVIVPGINLVSNIGFDKLATHTTEVPGGLRMDRYSMQFPMLVPESEAINVRYDNARQKEIFQLSIITRIKRRLFRKGK